MRRFLLVSLCMALWATACVRRPPSAGSGPISTTPSVDGVPIRFDVHGEGRPTLVFVHGWTCDRAFWRLQVQEFARTNQVVTIDLAGHGQSGRGRTSWSMGSFGEDVAAVVRALRLTDVVLIGHSMGGAVIAEAASRLPTEVRGLVGVDTWFYLSATRTAEQAARVASPFKSDFRAAARAEIHRMFTPATDTVLAAWILERMESTPAEVGLAALDAILEWDRPEAEAAFGRIRAPVVAINADTYARTNLDGAHGVVPSLQLTVMSGYGHFVMLEDPARFNALLRQAIATMPAPVSLH